MWKNIFRTLGLVGSWAVLIMGLISCQSHTVSTPDMPSGPSTGQVGESLAFVTGGARCSHGHSVQYRFDWGDGTYSNWSFSTTATKSWNNPGIYYVRAQACCAQDNSVVSDWSSAFTVTISTAHTVSTPTTPTGPSLGTVGQSLTFSTGGASCSQGHPVEYRFDWGDGTYSSWSSTPTASHYWTAPGTYHVKAQARCSVDSSITSPWSPTHSVAIASDDSKCQAAIILDEVKLIYNNHVGNEWQLLIEINEKRFSVPRYGLPKTIATFQFGHPIDITVRAIAIEEDTIPDVGSASTSFRLGCPPSSNSYTATLDVLVRENRGRYAGNTALWRFKVRVEIQVGRP